MCAHVAVKVALLRANEDGYAMRVLFANGEEARMVGVRVW